MMEIRRGLLIDDGRHLGLTPILEDLNELQLSSTKKNVKDYFNLWNSSGHIPKTFPPGGDDKLGQSAKT